MNTATALPGELLVLSGQGMRVGVIGQTAFKLHKEKLLSRGNLVDILQDLVNASAMDNGYAEKHGLPFPARRSRRRGPHVP